jgi:hypothetical protein
MPDGPGVSMHGLCRIHNVQGVHLGVHQTVQQDL